MAFAKAKAKGDKKDKKEQDQKRKQFRAGPVNFDGRSAQSMLRNAYRAQLYLLSLAET